MVEVNNKEVASAVVVYFLTISDFLLITAILRVNPSMDRMQTDNTFFFLSHSNSPSKIFKILHKKYTINLIIIITICKNDCFIVKNNMLL